MEAKSDSAAEPFASTVDIVMAVFVNTASAGVASADRVKVGTFVMEVLGEQHIDSEERRGPRRFDQAFTSADPSSSGSSTY